MDRATHLRERETKLLDDALGALTRNTGLNAVVVTREPKPAKGPRPDATIEIEEGGRRFRFFVEIKAIDRAVARSAAKHKLEP
jgi:hypothetical protein